MRTAKPGDKLEAYRDCHLVGEFGMQSRLFSGDILPFLFHDSANTAFYMAVDALKAMQDSPVIGPTQYGIPAVNMWFLSVESLISTLYKIVLDDSESTKSRGAVRKTQKLLEKAEQIDSYISGGKATPSQMRLKLTEFATFRNTLFHDLTYVKRPTYSHTVFAVKAEKMNQVDLMQAIIVAVNTFRYYRGAIHDIDLLPKVFINAQFDAVDLLSEEVLFPAFSEILGSRQMATDLKLEFSTESLGFELDIEARILIRHDGPTFPEHNPTNPAIVHRLLTDASTRRPVDPTIFKVPDYTANARSTGNG
ncbi:MAG: hypothetical protein OEV04_16895 [Nitrospira sp.]|nr:hypothetical protein [Nitrospira sp.]